MSNSIIYQKSQTLKGDINILTLEQEINLLNISKIVKTIVDIGTEFVVVFDDDLSVNEVDSLDSAIAIHNHRTPEEEVKIIVSNAIKFGQELIIDFASQNVLMGITQAGKTKDVADYLSNLMRYAQSGSLYEVINETNLLISQGLPSDLSPFITESRMNEFKQKVIDYLS